MSYLSVYSLKGDVKSQMSSLHKSVDNDPVNDDPASSKIGSLVRGINQGKKVVMSGKQLDASEGWVRELFLRSCNDLSSKWVPKHLISIDEKYIRCCLEMIYISAFDAPPSGCHFNLNSLELGLFAQGWSAHRISRRGLADAAGKTFIYHQKETGGSGDIALSPVEQWVVGSITESDSMKNILRSPLFQKIGMLETASKFGMTDVTENKRFLRPRLTGSSELSYTSSQKLEKDDLSVGCHLGFVSGSPQRSPVSVSSMDSMLIDQASCSCSYPRNYRAMLQCSWKDSELPHFEFSVDDQNELYMASPVDAQPANEKSDHVYVFQMKHSSSQYDDSSGWNSAEVIGKMKVSTSYTLCPCNSKIVETEFVFYGLGEIHGSELQSVSSLRGSKHRKLSRVMELFKSSQLFKQRSNSRYGGGSSAIFESLPEQSQEVGSRSVSPMKITDPFLQGFPTNLELAAIVVKSHVHEEDRQQHSEDIGGWGLKFLKKTGVKQLNPTPRQYSGSPPPCGKISEQCAKSTTDILLSTGIHGMPISGKELPSCIIERWKSGGSCDCGGWDVGCPLTVLKSISREEEGVPGSDRQNHCKSFDVYPEGSEQGAPILKMTNVHDGLYFVNFRSTVSVVQCFSVAVAMVHSNLSSLLSKQCKGVKLQEYL